MIGESNKENVKMSKNSCANCCLCPGSKRSKHSVSEESLEKEQIDLSMVTSVSFLFSKKLLLTHTSTYG